MTMADAPKQIGIIGNFLGEWALATRDERDQAVVYTRADLIDLDVLRRVEAALETGRTAAEAQTNHVDWFVSEPAELMPWPRLPQR